MVTKRNRRNPWPLTRTKKSGKGSPVSTCGRRSTATVSQATQAAYKAGHNKGDTGLFQDWLCERGFQDRGKPLVSRLRKEFERGVEDAIRGVDMDGSRKPTASHSPAHSPAPATRPATKGRHPNPRKKLRPRPLPPWDGPAPNTGQYIYLSTDDGGLYWTKEFAGTTHVMFARKRGIPSERIVAGGWINDGVMSDNSRSDSARYGERGRASMTAGTYLNPRPLHTREELERLPSETLDRMAFGFVSGDTRTVPVSSIHPTNDDIENAIYAANRYKGGPKAWAKAMDFSEPIELKLKGGKLLINDGHHRYYAATLLKKKTIRAVVEIDDNAIDAILGGRDQNPRPLRQHLSEGLRDYDTISGSVYKYTLGMPSTIAHTFLDSKNPGGRGYSEGIMANNPHGEPTGFRKAQYAYRIVRTNMDDVLGYNQDGSTVYAPVKEYRDSKAEAIKRGKEWHLETGHPVEVFDPNTYKVLWASKSNPSTMISSRAKGYQVGRKLRGGSPAKLDAITQEWVVAQGYRGASVEYEAAEFRKGLEDAVGQWNKTRERNPSNPAGGYYAYVGPYKGSKVGLLQTDTATAAVYRLLMNDYQHGHGPIKVWELGSFQEYQDGARKFGKRGGPPPTWTITDGDLQNFKDAYLATEDEGGEFERNLNRVVERVIGGRSNPYVEGVSEDHETIPSEIPVFQGSHEELPVEPFVEYTTLAEALAYAQAVKGIHPDVGVVGFGSDEFGVVLSSSEVREAEAGTLVEGEVEGTRENPALSTKDPRTMTPAQVNKELEKIRGLESLNNRKFIDAGRGHERPSEYMTYTDPLSLEAQAIDARKTELRLEVTRRMGYGANEFPSGWRPSKAPWMRNPGGRFQMARVGTIYKPYGVIDTQTIDRVYQTPASVRGRDGKVRAFSTEKSAQAYADRLNATASNPQSRNPVLFGGPDDSKASADKLYEDFHGRASEECLMVETEIIEPDHLAVLGSMVSMKVETVSGFDVEIGFEEDPPYLCSSTDGTQLYFQAGNQSIDLEALEMSGEDWERQHMVIGDLTETTYRTQKSFDKFQTIDYYHANGEESGIPPQLLYDPINRVLSVAGGRYKVLPEGIVD